MGPPGGLPHLPRAPTARPGLVALDVHQLRAGRPLVRQAHHPADGALEGSRAAARPRAARRRPPRHLRALRPRRPAQGRLQDARRGLQEPHLCRRDDATGGSRSRGARRDPRARPSGAPRQHGRARRRLAERRRLPAGLRAARGAPLRRPQGADRLRSPPRAPRGDRKPAGRGHGAPAPAADRALRRGDARLRARARRRARGRDAGRLRRRARARARPAAPGAARRPAARRGRPRAGGRVRPRRGRGGGRGERGAQRGAPDRKRREVLMEVEAAAPVGTS